MTDLATAMADTSKLSPFDGCPVVRTAIAVTKAGDGLSEALKVDPQEYHVGDKVYVVLECEVAAVRFKPVDKDTPDVLVREHTLRAGTATMVDGDLVATQLAEQAERIQLAKEAAEGVARLPYEGNGDDPDGEGSGMYTDDEGEG